MNLKKMITEMKFLPMKARTLKFAIESANDFKLLTKKCKLYLEGKISASELSLYIKDFKFMLPKDQERLDKFAHLMVGHGKLPLYTEGLDYINYDLDMNPLYDNNGEIIDQRKYDEMVQHMDNKRKYMGIAATFGADPEYAKIRFKWAEMNPCRGGNNVLTRWSTIAGPKPFNNFIEEDIMEEMHQRYNEGSLYAQLCKSFYDKYVEEMGDDAKIGLKYQIMACSKTPFAGFKKSILNQYKHATTMSLFPSIMMCSHECQFNGGFKLDNPGSMNIENIIHYLQGYDRDGSLTDGQWISIVLLASLELLREQIYRNTIFYLVLERKDDYEEQCAKLNAEMAVYNTKVYNELCGWIEKLAFDNNFRNDLLALIDKYKAITDFQKIQGAFYHDLNLDISNIFIKYGFGDLYICHKYGGFMSEKKKELREICAKYAPDMFLDLWSSALDYLYDSNEIERWRKDSSYSEAAATRKIERYQEYDTSHTREEVRAMAEKYRNNWKKQNTPQFAK